MLANIFLHYAFDTWMQREFPHIRFERYCDDVIVHCVSEKQARFIRDRIARRLAGWKLELNPAKTQIVYCKDDDRRGSYHRQRFDFLGYTFRPRLSRNRYGKHFVNFTPAVSDDAAKAVRREIRRWKLHRRSDKSLGDLARMFNAIVQGWINYYGRFYKSELYPLLRGINEYLVRWACQKYKRLRRRENRARRWLASIARREPNLFAHWRFGLRRRLGGGSPVSGDVHAGFCESRGVRFPPATHLRIYVRSERAAQRVLDTISEFIERRLKLKVNREKSGVARATKRGLLGFGFFRRDERIDVRIDFKAIKAVKDRIRQLTSRTKGISMSQRIAEINRFIRGWTAYFALTEAPWILKELDKWLRRRLRQVYWKQWKKPKTRRRKLKSLGIPDHKAHEWSYARKGAWRIAGSPPLTRALPNSHFERIGLVGFNDCYDKMRAVWRTA